MFQEREGDELFDSELRITFDDCLEYLDCHRFRSPWRPIIESSESVMEIKSARPYPPWLTDDSVGRAHLIPASFTGMATLYQMRNGCQPRARIIEGLCVVVRGTVREMRVLEIGEKRSR
ncbi:MAG: hypothetical protein ACLTDR_04115 [Adlercreutzia equolifaciens]